jgi:hypothetical protein
MNEILFRLYEGMVKSNLPEILNACPLLDELRYLALVAVAPISPFGLAKTEFNRSDLRKIAKYLRLRYEYYHEAPEVLEKRLAKFGLIVASERDSKIYYSITKEGEDEVVKRTQSLDDLAEVTKLEQKFLVPGRKATPEEVVLPKNVVHLVSEGMSFEDLLTIEDELVGGLALRSQVRRDH